KGAVTVHGDGTFTYTPSAASRETASATTGTDTDVFTVSIVDGHGGTATSTVTVVVAPAFVVGQNPTSGTPEGGVILSQNGSRAVQISYVYDSPSDTVATPHITVIDPKTGRVIGTSIPLQESSSVPSVSINANGTRAVAVQQFYDPTTETLSSTVTVINTVTGTVVGTPVSVAGGGYSSLSPDGSRAVVAGIESVNVTVDQAVTSITVIDTATGEKVATSPVPV